MELGSIKMNSTITNFGYPVNIIEEYTNWVVMLRPVQLTLGSLILACKEDVKSFSALSNSSQRELSKVVLDIETTLKICFDYSKINYLMLMMVDPHVHFHVFPRYEGQRVFAGTIFEDSDWPGPPEVLRKTEIKDELFITLKDEIVKNWGS